MKKTIFYITITILILSSFVMCNNEEDLYDFTIESYPLDTQNSGDYAYFGINMDFSNDSNLYTVSFEPAGGEYISYMYWYFEDVIANETGLQIGAYPSSESNNPTTGKVTNWVLCVYDNDSSEIIHVSRPIAFEVNWY